MHQDDTYGNGHAKLRERSGAAADSTLGRKDTCHRHLGRTCELARGALESALPLNLLRSTTPHSEGPRHVPEASDRSPAEPAGRGASRRGGSGPRPAGGIFTERGAASSCKGGMLTAPFRDGLLARLRHSL